MRYLFVAMIVGCGGTASSTPASGTTLHAEAAPSEAESSSASVSAPDSASVPDDAIAFVSLLRTIAASEPDTLGAHVDVAFGRRLPSGDDLGPLLTHVPAGCVPTLEEGPGYGMIAIPPPMNDDSDEEAARIEAIIAELSESTEVSASCAMVETIDGEEVRTERLLWTVAVRREPEGRFVVLAWRDLTNER
jgi:hypothetical protein